MAFGEVKLVPGVQVEQTQTLNKVGIFTANLVRWKQGLLEKIGGWVRFYPFSVGSIPRDLHVWQDLNTNDHLSVGATQSLSVITNGALANITPQTTTTNTAPDFTTTANSPIVQIVDTNISNPTTNNSVFIATPVAIDGLVLQGLYPITSVINVDTYQITASSNAIAGSSSAAVPEFTTTLGQASVTVTLDDHGYIAGETFPVLVSTTGGGITIFGTYLIRSITDVNNFVIIASNTATSGASFFENGGNVQLTYYIAIGPQGTLPGYGSGLYGAGAYGIGISGPSGTGTPITATDWTQANWGEILLSCPENGPIYQWSPDSGFQTAAVVGTAPVLNAGIFVAMPYQILIAYGSSKTGSPNPLQVSWSTSGDYTNWVPTTTDQAGDYEIPSGSMIVGGMQANQQGLIWTDIELWSMQYIGTPFIFGFSKIMAGCGLIGSHAMGILGSTVFWMSQQQFFMMPAGGAPTPMPCSVWDYIFQNLDTVNAWKIRCSPNSTFNTISWQFPSLSGGTGENDSFVEFNAVEGEWVTGKYPSTGRSAWVDQSVLGTPIGATPTGLIYQHEVGYNGDGAAINPTFTTGYFVIGDGEQFCFLDQFIHDFKYGLQGGSQTANLLITLSVVNYPSDTPTQLGPYTVNAAQNYVSTRLRGRQVALTGQSLDLDSFWRIGLIRYRFAADGRR